MSPFRVFVWNTHGKKGYHRNEKEYWNIMGEIAGCDVGDTGYDYDEFGKHTEIV